MSETLRESDIASSNGDAAPESSAPARHQKPSNLAAVRTIARAADDEVQAASNGTDTVELTEPTPTAPEVVTPSPAAYVAEIELRLGELAEIEKMRDLEIHHLEAEIEEQADLVRKLETALFHAERRATDLEKRWSDLAGVYETAAAALVIAGGQLEEIHQQVGYRLVLSVSRALRRYPALYQRLHRRLHRGDAK